MVSQVEEQKEDSPKKGKVVKKAVIKVDRDKGKTKLLNKGNQSSMSMVAEKEN